MNVVVSRRQHRHPEKGIRGYTTDQYINSYLFIYSFIRHREIGILTYVLHVLLEV